MLLNRMLEGNKEEFISVKKMLSVSVSDFFLTLKIKDKGLE